MGVPCQDESDSSSVFPAFERHMVPDAADEVARDLTDAMQQCSDVSELWRSDPSCFHLGVKKEVPLSELEEGLPEDADERECCPLASSALVEEALARNDTKVVEGHPKA